MKYSEHFFVNGNPLLVPDENVSFTYNDLDSSDSGRDESGYMHRTVIRHKMGSWKFEYSNITDEQKEYMESIFGNHTTFQFTHPGRIKTYPHDLETTECYRSNYGISWKNARTGLWSGYSFTIAEC